MPPRLILNADDFGLTPGINRAIVALAHAGALTSATLMATGPAFEDAVLQSRAAPGLGLGCHVVLVDGTPASPPHTIPSLLGPDRRSFRRSLLEFAQAALLGRIRTEDLVRESLAQIQKLHRAGIAITHLDTHKHAHLLPPVSLALLEAARIAQIKAIRNPFEPRWSRRLGHGTHLRHLQLHLLSRLERRFQQQLSSMDPAILTTNGTLGIAATGRLNTTTLLEILHQLPSGVWELVCHPGNNDSDLDQVTTRLRAHRETELQALLEVVPALCSPPGAPILHLGPPIPHPDSPISPPGSPILHPGAPILMHYGDLACLPPPRDPQPPTPLR